MEPNRHEKAMLVAEQERMLRLLEDFKKSEVAKYFDEVLDAALGEVDRALRTADTLERVKYLQGKGDGLNYWQLLPDTLTETWTRRVAAARAELGPDEGNEQ